ncbi:NUDIX domain-containing protein [Saccharomonospora sp.]|uniref:NUDIX hydrolase n=1 Tax=Saccharomonospora sp. TaxID=33913 RepID=UPI0026277599|nr:NUDIX domain-containing protein [Saccharomonospora sp.]
MRSIDKVAWVRIEDGRVLAARSRDKDTYYLPGGKRETGEADIDTLVREVAEELSVTVVRGTESLVGTFEAPAHGQDPAVVVRMTCYTADYEGTFEPSNEIEELRWLGPTERLLMSRVSRLVLDHLFAA